jgi:hypothetical protein
MFAMALGIHPGVWKQVEMKTDLEVVVVAGSYYLMLH